jgi:hypothetical protein
MTSPRPAGGEGQRRDARQAGPASPGAARGRGGSLENGPAGQAARARLDLVDAFVRRHFTWPGTLRLHRAAIGLDILRAPVNVLMSPILLLARLSAWICRRLHRHRAADWLSRRRFLLRTAVAARVETAVLTELLDVPLVHGENPEALRQAILVAPRLREAIRRSGSVGGAQEMAEGVMRAVAEYTGTRSAIAELTTALVTLAVGALAFQALTPGMISMAPGVAEAVSRGTAIADFPLGSRLGSVWYAVFPAGPAPWLIAATVAGLVLLGSVVAAFAGTLADPVQARLGIHRRRLMRLLDAVDAEVAARHPRPFVAHEHLLVRVFDLWDAALSMLRIFRG